MFDLSLCPTVINGHRYKDDYAVIRKADFGERRVGRIRCAEGSGLGAVWVFHIFRCAPEAMATPTV